MNTSIVQHDPVILRLIQASTALTEAKSIQQTKSILDVAAAAEIYAKRQQLGEDAIGIAHSIKIEALRKLGEMLQESPKNTGARGVGKSGVPNKNPTLEELGLDKKTSSVAQKLAELPEEAFKQVRDGHETVAKAIAAVSQTKQPGTKPTFVQPESPSDATQELRAHIEELTATAKILLEENTSMGAVMDADDKLAALTAENKKLRELNRVLNERIHGLQNECNEAKRAAKMWRAKHDKMEKLAA